MKKVLLGAPVRDRAWILPRFIKHLKALDLTNIELDCLFIANDCIDNTIELLKNSDLNVKEYNNLASKTEGSVRGKYGYSHLANLRNILVEEFLKTDNEYLFSCDTDVLLPRDSLVRLLNHDKDICSMLLCNQKGELGRRAHNIMYYDEEKKVYQHYFKWDNEKIIPVDLTGAVYVIHRRVLESGVRYGFDRQGEDIPFCRIAQQKEFEIYCDTSIKPIHVMYEGVELIGGF